MDIIKQKHLWKLEFRRHKRLVSKEYTPFKTKKACVQAIKEHPNPRNIKRVLDISDSRQPYYYIADIDSKGITIDSEYIPFEVACVEYTFADGIPFGSKK